MVSHANSLWATTLTSLSIPPSLYTIHSVRKASASTAHSKGFPELLIQQLAGWKSLADRNYIYK